MLKEKLPPIILFPLAFMFVPVSGFIISLMFLQGYYLTTIISLIVVILTCIWIMINVNYNKLKKNDILYRVYLTKDEIEELICGLEDLDYDIKTFSESGKSEPNPLIHKLKSIIEE